MSDLDAAVDSFASRAQTYCVWLEALPNAKESNELEILQKIADLYAAALYLPDIGADHLPDDLDTPELARSDLEQLRTSLRAIPFQYYWELFHSVTPEPEETVCGDLVDDLVDIYNDVKEGLLAFEKGSTIVAVWHWRTTFGLHWGRHAASAIKALQDYEPPDD